ncbi:hypothetical protein Sru01_52800 [Sphaerisporangium rufum]|uniref:XRE family transcriptional regulator n=1 Tax=Sphaerisporangium rufum TaxID=1381558 RepID=A0A919R6R9_9ACTN|nr:helix-turn-helix transcriptional regulator [Sphaerisporangium rufum]GII80298.1 hypothetical protein Sru01_52800 [Sphaerisporangium rufum]
MLVEWVKPGPDGLPVRAWKGVVVGEEMIDPHASVERLFGAVLRHFRQSRSNMSLRRAGELAFTDFSNLGRFERGERMPAADLVARLDQIYGAGGMLSVLHAVMLRLQAAESVRPHPGRYGENSTLGMGDDEMERRTALHLLAGLGTLSTFGIATEPLRRLLDTDFEHPGRDLADWEQACADHLYALRTRPPAQVAADLVIDLAAVRQQTRTAPPAQATELHRITAMLAALHANALTRLADHGAAVRWWDTARQAADTSGDLTVRLLVRAEAAGHGLYGQRDPGTILHMVHSTQQLIDKPYPELLITKAKAMSMLGRHDEALATLTTLRRSADHCTADQYGFWTSNKIDFAESWVYAAAGKESAADTARENVLKSARDYLYLVNVQLHGAMCTVTRGGIDEGVRQAAAAIDTLAPAYRSNHIMETGNLVLRAVPPEQRGRDSVIEFRKLLTTPPPQSTYA